MATAAVLFREQMEARGFKKESLKAGGGREKVMEASNGSGDSGRRFNRPESLVTAQYLKT